MPRKKRKKALIQVSTRLTKRTLINLEVLVQDALFKGEYIDRNKLTRKAIEEFINIPENKRKITAFQKNQRKEYREIEQQYLGV